MDMDWREILRFSQKELTQSEKEKLCESLSWMEVDDIELNFTDLKILFKLSQDILKYKTEQVNSAMDKIDKTKRKTKTKERSTITESPAMSSDSVLETIEHQEEVIRANKDILEQLYSDIAELEGRKSKKRQDKSMEQESVSSRATLSEMNAVATLENEVTKKNRHIRKLLSDVKILEEENVTLKEKLMIFKNKLKESTLLIENLTEQLFTLSKENTNAKDFLGKSEQEKANMLIEIENLQKEVNTKHYKTEQTEEEVKSKFQHFKNLLKSQKNEIERVINENTHLKEELEIISKSVGSPNERMKKQEETRNIELQEKLSEASQQMLQSAKLIQSLKDENKKLKSIIEDIPEHSMSEQKNESDDGKERHFINKLKRKIKQLTIALQGSEEMLMDREKEITEIAAQLQLLRSDDGLNALIESIKNKKKHLRIKDEGIKSLVHEVNNLNEIINQLQLENESMREKMDLPANAKIKTHGILKKYRDLENANKELIRKLQEYENRLITLELDNRYKKAKMDKNQTTIKTQTVDKTKDYDCKDKIRSRDEIDTDETNLDVKTLLNENEGLRNGLTEVFNFLKDNSTTAGVLLLECPSLEALLNSMEARKAAGWFSPHMKTVMELKAALGGKDALLSALNESRRETFDVLKKLALEEQKSSDLEKKLQENIGKEEIQIQSSVDLNMFGSWMKTEDYKNIDVNEKNQVEKVVNTGNIIFENDFKQVLLYFQDKFSLLFEKFTSLTISASDDFNKWTIQEEQYKAEIENLKSQIDHDDDSNLSPGLLTLPNSNIDRKCSFLEDLYKQIRTENENIKNEYFEAKRERLTENSEYERKIQRLLINVLIMSDQLRNSIPLEVFYKQSEDLNKYIIKYRNVLEITGKRHIESEDLVQRLNEIKLDILTRFQKESDQKENPNKIVEVEQSILQQQLRKICLELTDKNKDIENLEKTILDLQLAQSELTDKIFTLNSKEDNFYETELQKRNDENKILKEQYDDANTKLNKTYLQLQTYQQKELANDIELNMLRHQILDLQSLGDNKAIIARLSGEILLAQLQVTESYDKIETLKMALNKEKQLRAETEDVLMSRQKVFDINSRRFDNRVRVMSEIMDTLRQQYQGNLPLVAVENYINKLEEIKRKTNEVNEKLNDIEDLQSTLMTKHSLYNNMLDHSNTKCFDDDTCPHKMKILITEKTQKLEAEHCKKKLLSSEEAYKTLLDRCDHLEKTLILVNQGFKAFEVPLKNEHPDKQDGMDLKVENIHSEDEISSISSCSRKSRTYTLSPPNVNYEKITTANKSVQSNLENKKIAHQKTQTIRSAHFDLKKTSVQFTQTDIDQSVNELKTTLNNLMSKENKKDKIIEEMDTIAKQREHDFIILKNKNIDLEDANKILSNINIGKDEFSRELQTTIQSLKKEITDLKLTQKAQITKMKEAINVDNQSVMDTLKQIEIDKNKLIEEYKELLDKERQEYSDSVNELQTKIRDLQMQLDQEDTNTVTSDVKEVGKHHLKIRDLETKNFKLQSDFESSQGDLIYQQSELDRWKSLASERLTKMELLSTQLKERHNHEMESYKAENQHWVSQLKETQREHMELRNRLSEQKTLHLRQIAEKDALVEKLRSVINNLKSQILNMQTMLTINDPSFDLSAIVEVDEASETISLQGSDRLELKFESTVDFTEMEDDVVKLPSTSTAIWQEPQIDRLRREKQLMIKQNTSLRRQVKLLAARERRARLDSQNLKNQVYRISTSGNKAPPVETRSLRTQHGVAAREQAAAIALWDKMKRAQQTSERWQVRYEEKCQEANKLEISLNLAKSAVVRLEKEKRVLLARLTEAKHDKNVSIEKQECETPEKALVQQSPTASSRALAARVEAQQRRIVALELAGQGNDTLVSEYERALAQITSLKGQVLKLESTLLETQIRSPLTHTDVQPEVDYWKNYCDMLKEENLQLTMKINTLDHVPTSAQHHKVNDLEQTVLTLRGLVSKLQAEKSSNTNIRKNESRPTSSRAGPDKVESYRIEITNLKRSIIEKDALLEKSKEMLKVAAEREDYLLRENSHLRRRVEQLIEIRGGFLSA